MALAGWSRSIVACVFSLTARTASTRFAPLLSSVVSAVDIVLSPASSSFSAFSTLLFTTCTACRCRSCACCVRRPSFANDAWSLFTRSASSSLIASMRYSRVATSLLQLETAIA